MATVITSECINCGACEPECPNTAIYQGGVEWQAPDGAMHAAISNDIFYIVPEKCTECVGFYDQEACAKVCPVDCCVPDPERPESEALLLVRARALHPDKTIPDDAPGALLGRRAADRLRSAPGRARLAPPATPLATRRAAALAPGRRAGSPRRARRGCAGAHRRVHRRPPLLQPPAGYRGQRLPEPGALPHRDPGARGERRTGGPLQPGRPQVDLPRARARLHRGRVPDAREPLRRRALRRGAGPRRPLRAPGVAARPPGRPARGRAWQRERRRLRRLLRRGGALRREARARAPLRLDLQDRGPRRCLHPAPRLSAPPPALVARRRARTPARDARLRLRAQPPGRHFRGARAGRRPAGAEADVPRARLSARVHDARVAPRPGRRLPAPLPGQDPRGHPAEGWRVGPAVPASAVLGCGRHLPARTVTDEELARDLGASGARLAELTGVTRRHHADDGHGPSDLAREAALAALASAGLGPADVALTVFAPLTPDRAS